MKVVSVSWLDSESRNDWTPLKDISEPLSLTYSVGFLVEETENSIVLALSYDPGTESVNCFKHIPIVAIEELRTLCETKIETK